MLHDPNTRTNLFNAWYAGDTSYADRILRKETGLNATEFTIKMGRTPRYRKVQKKMGEKNADGGGYLFSRGIATLQGSWPWTYTTAAMPILLTETMQIRDFPTAALVTTFDIIYGGLFTLLSQIPFSILAHETMHYMAEGQGHSGWYPMTFLRKY